MPKRKLQENTEEKHRNRTMFSFFPKVPKADLRLEAAELSTIDSVHDTAENMSETGATVSPTLSPNIDKKAGKTGSLSNQTDDGRHFSDKWLQEYTWLQYDAEKNVMTCSLCIKHKKTNAMTTGTSNFRTSTLSRHADHKDHKAAVLGENLRPDFNKAVNKALLENEQAVTVALKTVYFLATEDIPMYKYERFIQFLADCDCPHVGSLKQGKKATYDSETSANDMLESIAAVIRKDIDNKVLRSPFISIFADESTDIGMEKKLVIYARGVNPDNNIPSTYFLENVKVASGTGQVVSQAILDCLEARKIPMTRVMGFGTDGAKAMTGTKEGATGHLMRVNPMMLNYHCIAHRLALVSSQAAESIPYMKEYQETLTGLFYFFKGSANRNEKLKDIQTLLDEPLLKIKEVHEVRWMSIYKAVETVYRCLDSLISVFSTDKDAKAKGYAKKIGNSDFISTTYMLMDVLPIIIELCLVFQKKDLDVSLVQVSVEQCLKDLESYKTGDPVPLHPTYIDQLQEHLKTVNGRLMFKDNHIVSKGSRNVQNLKASFVDKLIENLKERFPEKDSNIMYALGCLAMRPLSFLSKEQLNVWGDEKIHLLTEHFGKEKEHSFGSNEKTTAEAIINAEETKKEWRLIKPLVMNEGYSRDRMPELWTMIYKNHREVFPNLLKLAAIALTAPIHTAECERGFSKQNKIKTSLRNRIKPERVDDLITVKCEGSEIDFSSVIKHWNAKKNRRISL